MTIIPFINVICMFGVAVVWAVAISFIATAGEYEIKFLNETVSVNPEEFVAQVCSFAL